jgi:type I restriction enzyme R subunit
VTIGDLASLGDRVAKLPTELEPEPEDAKRFDVIMLGAELALVRGEPFERQRQIVMKVAAALEEQQAIPAIAQQLELIQDIQHDEWWIDATYSMLEEIRKKLRLLVPLIERSKKNIVYTKFTDELGTGVEVELPGIGGANESTEFAQFRKKAQHFLKENLAETAVAKVRSGETLTNADIADLQRILVAAGIGDDSTFEQAAKKAGSFGKFIRGLVGLDRAAAKEAFAEFLDDKRYSKNQIQFVTLIIDELTERGVVDVARVYEAPYIGLAPEGPETMFVESDLDRIFELLERWANVESVS